MEDILDLYAEPFDAKRPKVNFDETSKQLIKETRQPLPAQPGKPQRFDDEYERNGTRNLFLFVDKRTIEVLNTREIEKVDALISINREIARGLTNPGM